MKMVGITSCIAGLAHTPMAAKALEKAGKNLGHKVRIEQQEATGAVHELTAKEIEEADVVIIATDKAIDGEERFKNKKIVRAKIGQCITSPEAILRKIAQALENKK